MRFHYFNLHTPAHHADIKYKRQNSENSKRHPHKSNITNSLNKNQDQPVEFSLALLNFQSQTPSYNQTKRPKHILNLPAAEALARTAVPIKLVLPLLPQRRALNTVILGGISECMQEIAGAALGTADHPTNGSSPRLQIDKFAMQLPPGVPPALEAPQSSGCLALGAVLDVQVAPEMGLGVLAVLQRFDLAELLELRHDVEVKVAKVIARLAVVVLQPDVRVVLVALEREVGVEIRHQDDGTETRALVIARAYVAVATGPGLVEERTDLLARLGLVDGPEGPGRLGAVVDVRVDLLLQPVEDLLLLVAAPALGLLTLARVVLHGFEFLPDFRLLGQLYLPGPGLALLHYCPVLLRLNLQHTGAASGVCVTLAQGAGGGGGGVKTKHGMADLPRPPAKPSPRTRAAVARVPLAAPGACPRARAT